MPDIKLKKGGGEFCVNSNIYNLCYICLISNMQKYGWRCACVCARARVYLGASIKYVNIHCWRCACVCVRARARVSRCVHDLADIL
jgi:hypothetical protein